MGRDTAFPLMRWMRPFRPFVLLLTSATLVFLSPTAAEALSVIGWGQNFYGQSSPPPDVTNTAAMAAGATHSVLLREDGTVVAWGNNGHGQTNVPPQLSGVTAIAAGHDHTIALCTNSTVTAWGWNTAGQTNVPIDLTNAIAIAAGGFHSLAVRSDRTVVAWGRNNFGQSNVPPNLSNVVGIAAGYNHSLALKADGTVVAWGAIDYGQTDVPADLDRVVAIAAGDYHSLALRVDGRVFAWGNTSVSGIPTNVTVLGLAAGASYSLALDSDHRVFAWGSSVGTNVPSEVQGNALAIAAGGYHSLAITGLATRLKILGTSGDSQYSGHTATLAVLAAGPNLAYQWQFNGTNINNATNAELQFPNAQATESGTYTIAITNSRGTVTSNVLLTVVDAAPIFLTQPSNSSIIAASESMFQVSAEGSEPLSYRWRFNGADISGATNATLVLTKTQLADTGAYQCIVSNVFGIAVSQMGTLSVQPLLFEVAPENQIVPALTNVTFRVVAFGSGPFTYQWRKDGIDLTNDAIFFGAQAPTLTIRGVQSEDEGSYSVLVSNSLGAIVTPDAVLTVAANGYTTLDGFNSAGGAPGTVYSLALQSDGKILVGGENSPWEKRDALARFNADGSPDPQFHDLLNYPAEIGSLVVQPDGKILVGGYYATLAGQARHNIARLNRDGTLDQEFDPDADGGVLSLAAQADGKILAAGFFTKLAGQPRNGIARLNADGTLDSAFNPTGGYFVYVLAEQPDGKILVGGSFTEFGGQARKNIARLNADGTLDLSFNPTAEGYVVYALALQADGKILVSGHFTSLGGQPRTNLGRLNSNGTLDVGFNPRIGNVVSMALQTDGKIFVGGYWNSDSLLIARLNSDGMLEFDVPGDAIAEVSSLAIQSDGKILVGGDFMSFWGRERYGLLRLNNLGVAIQSLNYNGSTVSWLRAGTSPEVWRTTFEHSSNGISWTNLGAGTRIPGGWRRDGLTLAPGSTIRARGYITGGQYNSSGWYVESMTGAPGISFHPYSLINTAGTTATFSISAGGTEPLSYQWQFNGTNIAGATKDTLTLTNVQLAQMGDYTVLISNALGQVSSSAAQLDVLTPPIVPPLPASAMVTVSSNITLSVEAIGTPPFVYQWRKNGANIPGATNNTYTIANVQVSDGGTYTVAVKNNYGAATTDPMSLIVEVPQRPPGDSFADRVLIGTNTLVGGTNRFATKEPGEPNHGGKRGGKSVWYTWQAPATGIATFRTTGSGFDTLLGVYTGDDVANLVTIASDEDLGGFFTSEIQFNALVGTNYHIAVDGFAEGEGDFVVSWELETTPDKLPLITLQPRSQAILFSTDVNFALVAQGSGLTYQWQLNGAVIPGATNASLVRSNVQPADVGYYTVRVRNSDGREVVSLPALLEIVSRSMPLTVDKLEDFLESGYGGAGNWHIAAPIGPDVFGVGLGSVDYRISNNNSNTTELHEPNHCDTISGASRWMKVKPTTNGVFHVDTVGSAIDTVLTVYRDTNLIYLSTAQVACDDNSLPDGASHVHFNAVSNTAYLFLVDGVKKGTNFDTGNFRLNWTFGTPPTLVSNPQPRQVAHASDNILLSALSTNGIPPPRFQWYWNGVPLAGATNATYSLSGLKRTDAGFFSVVVSNALGAVTYDNAVIIEQPKLEPELKASNRTLMLWLPTGTNAQSVLEASTDLRTWVPLKTYSPLDPISSFELALTNSMQFFRTRPIQ